MVEEVEGDEGERERKGEWEKERHRTQDARRREEGRKPKVTDKGWVLKAPLLACPPERKRRQRGVGGGFEKV